MKKLSFVFFAVLLIASGVVISYQRALSEPIDSNPNGADFKVGRGENVETIGQNLFEARLISSTYLFRYYVWSNGLANKLQAGSFNIKPRLNLKETVATLMAAKRESKRILIREGETIEDMAAAFASSSLFAADDFLAVTGNPLTSQEPAEDIAGRYGFLADKPKSASLEGYLFPDTYDFEVGATPEAASVKMLDNFNRKLTPELRAKIKAQGRTIYETVIMASLVEKEVQTLEDMRIVSGIFWSRLSIGQALQSDATLSYILRDTTDAHTLEQLKSESPYNSYRYKGLPPTPISNPGINAIVAAIEPTPTSYNFFLTGKDGKVHYAKTFAEHIANKNKYLK